VSDPLYLPIPSLPRHDEPISAEDYERREWARRGAEKNAARILKEKRDE